MINRIRIAARLAGSRRFRGRILAGCVFLLASAWSPGADAAPGIRGRLAASAAADPDAPRLHCLPSLNGFYRARADAPAWSRDGRATAAVESLLVVLAAATAEGLEPEDYHFTEIGRLRRARSAADLADLDVLCSDAFLLYGTHALSGRLDPETIDPEWVANRRGGNIVQVLRTALEDGGVGPALRGLLPPQPGYGRLRMLLADLRRAEAEGWPPVPAGPKLAPGDSGPRVQALAVRLHAGGDLPSAPAAVDTVFEARIEEAVRRFQARHGLANDGVVGPATLAALNTTVHERIEQVKVNLERWRWLPQDLGHRYVLVNIADQSLRVVEDGRPVLEMAVIVGRSYRRTPVFSDRIRYLVLSPWWEVPPSLAKQDKLPELRKDPARLVDLGFEIYDGFAPDARRVDPLAVDWSSIRAESFRYRMRQKPGPRNALGTVKFMFPNKFNVYLHDTADRSLFARQVRTFSSGCIRVEKPLELVLELLADQPAWTPEAVRRAMASGEETQVRLSAPRPVHLEYWTAWVTPDGTAHFRDDIYGRDGPVAAALKEQPSPLPAANENGE